MAMIFAKNNSKTRLLKLTSSVFLIATLATWTSCSDKGSPLNPEDNPYPAENLSYSQHIRPIFLNNCALAGCHDAVSMQNGLDLESDPPDFLSDSNRLVVVPFFRSQSLLYELLFQSTQGIQRMPLDRARLNDFAIEAIGQWIDEGAIEN